MLVAFIEAVLRSLILALIVWAALRIFRVQNVVSQRYAWIGVLVGSLLMPFALPFTARWQVLPLATIPDTNFARAPLGARTNNVKTSLRSGFIRGVHDCRAAKRSRGRATNCNANCRAQSRSRYIFPISSVARTRRRLCTTCRRPPGNSRCWVLPCSRTF